MCGPKATPKCICKEETKRDFRQKRRPWDKAEGSRLTAKTLHSQQGRWLRGHEPRNASSRQQLDKARPGFSSIATGGGMAQLMS